MRAYPILITLTAAFSGSKGKKSTLSPGEMIDEFYSINNELHKFGCGFAAYIKAYLKGDTGAVDSAYEEFNARFKMISTERFYRRQADFLISLQNCDLTIEDKSGKVINYNSKESKERLDALIGLELVRRGELQVEGDSLSCEMIFSSTDHTYDNFRDEEFSDEDLAAIIDKWKLKGYDIPKMREAKNEYYRRWKEINSIAWSFQFIKIEKHHFTMRKENGRYKIDSFEIELLESRPVMD